MLCPVASAQRKNMGRRGNSHQEMVFVISAKAVRAGGLRVSPEGRGSLR